MRFEGAVIREQNVTFGIIIVKSHVLSSPAATSEMQRFGVQAFGPIPVVLMAQDTRGIPTYKGRRDIVNFLANIHPGRIPWKSYTID